MFNYLSLRDNKLTGNGVKVLANSLKSCRHFQSLDLSNNPIEEEDFVEFTQLTNLQYLAFQGCKELNNKQSLIKLFQNLTELQSLHLCKKSVKSYDHQSDLVDSDINSDIYTHQSNLVDHSDINDHISLVDNESDMDSDAHSCQLNSSNDMVEDIPPPPESIGCPCYPMTESTPTTNVPDQAPMMPGSGAPSVPLLNMWLVLIIGYIFGYIIGYIL